MRKDRGFVVLAQNTAETNYLRCAQVLAMSIARVMPHLPVTLVTDVNTAQSAADTSMFDGVVVLEHDLAAGDSWKLANDSQIYAASPYEHTIKIEADVFVPCDISWWFDVLAERDLAVCTTIRDYYNTVSTQRFYRKYIDANLLPDTYNGITYFRRSELAENFFRTVEHVFEHWAEFAREFTLYSEPSTDEVYALAATIVGEEQVTLPTFTDMSMIHMKRFVIDSELDDWTQELLYEVTDFNFKIKTEPQLYPVHYHVKEFAEILYKELRGE